MENKQIIWIIGIITVLIFAGIAYAEDTTTFGQLKTGDTVWYNGQETKVSATVPAVTNPDRIYVYLETGGDPIVGNKNDRIVSQTLTKTAPPAAPSTTTAGGTTTPTLTYQPVDQLKTGDKIMYMGQERTITKIEPGLEASEVKITFDNGQTQAMAKTGNAQVVTAPPTTGSTTPPAGETTGTINFPDQYTTGVGSQTSPAGFPEGGTTGVKTPAAQPLPQRQWPRATAEEYEAYEDQEREWIGQGKKDYPNFEGWLKNKRSQDYDAWKAGTQKETTTYEDFYSAGVFISQFLAAYDQYRGLSRFGSLFFTGDAWETYREKVNQAFCDTILLGGTQCWTSRICDVDFYKMMPKNVFAGRTPSGQAVATATIQGEKSLPIAAVDEQGNPIDMRVYKVTYAIRNPYDAQEIKYNVQFRTDDGYTFDWYDEKQTLAPGTNAQKTEDRPLIDYGRRDYAKVCLTFNPGITDYRNYHGRITREWCTDITQYQGTATRPYPAAADDTTVTPDPNAGQPPTVPTIPDRREGF